MEIERLADAGDTRDFFSATKVILCPGYQGLNPLSLNDGEVRLKATSELILEER